MNLQEIKNAVEDGQTVHWSNSSYRVVKVSLNQFLIVCENGSTIGLTWKDGKTMNGRPEDFYTPAN